MRNTSSCHPPGRLFNGGCVMEEEDTSPQPSPGQPGSRRGRPCAQHIIRVIRLY
ncbi:MAG: hypothetical protein ABII90_15325 [Bacteroidota bacterium]